MHDSMAFKESHAFKESEHLFRNGEWIWADSAYASTTWCIVPYWHPLSNEPSNLQFNYHLSRVCYICMMLLMQLYEISLRSISILNMQSASSKADSSHYKVFGSRSIQNRSMDLP